MVSTATKCEEHLKEEFKVFDKVMMKKKKKELEIRIDEELKESDYEEHLWNSEDVGTQNNPMIISSDDDATIIIDSSEWYSFI